MKENVVKLVILTLILTVFVIPISKASTVKNGVNCTKAAATIKVGSKLYRCSKNPFVKPNRNTWTLQKCLTAVSMWKDAKQQYEDWADLAKLAGADGENTMKELLASIAELESTMKEVACKRGA